jgi:two-component system OmpR family sensor kinase
VIQIAQDMRVRQILAREAAWRSLLPVVLLLRCWRWPCGG